MNRLLFGLSLLLLPALVQADLEVFDLRHRPAEEILPGARELAPEGVTLSGQGFRIVARGKLSDLEVLGEIVRSLDTLADNLRISIRRDEASQRRSRSLRGGVAANDGSSGSRARVRLRNSAEARQSRSTHSVLVRSGQSAWIDRGGEQLVVTDRVIGSDRAGRGVFAERLRSRSWRDGFLATAERHGDRVSVRIEVVRDGPLEADEASRLAVLTRLDANLGEWVRIAGVGADSGDAGRRVVARSSDARERDTTLWIRVDEVSRDTAPRGNAD